MKGPPWKFAAVDRAAVRRVREVLRVREARAVREALRVHLVHLHLPRQRAHQPRLERSLGVAAGDLEGPRVRRFTAHRPSNSAAEAGWRVRRVSSTRSRATACSMCSDCRPARTFSGPRSSFLRTRAGPT